MDMGERIAARIDALEPTVTRKAFAERVDMTPDALSRALSGKRGLASSELVRIAGELDADIHELVTGQPDPNRVSVYARHDFDPATAERSVPTFDSDRAILEDVTRAYAQAQLGGRQCAIEGASADEVRTQLGPDFVTPFADRVEERLGIDVIRLPELGTAYSASTLGRTFIAVAASGGWFRDNWSIAHELGHISGVKSESAANAFAAGLLLPERLVRAIDWATASQEAVADFLWETGVSTGALKNRLATFGLRVENSPDMLDQSTQRLLRKARSWSSAFGDTITQRMEAAGRRRFPVALQEAHEIAVEEGRIGPGYLAWMRGLDPEKVAREYEPAIDEPALDEMVEAFGLSRA